MLSSVQAMTYICLLQCSVVCQPCFENCWVVSHSGGLYESQKNWSKTFVDQAWLDFGYTIKTRQDQGTDHLCSDTDISNLPSQLMGATPITVLRAWGPSLKNPPLPLSSVTRQVELGDFSGWWMSSIVGVMLVPRPVCKVTSAHRQDWTLTLLRHNTGLTSNYQRLDTRIVPFVWLRLK